MSMNFLIRRIKRDEGYLSETEWGPECIIAHFAKEYGIGNVIYADNTKGWEEKNLTSITAAIKTFNTPNMVLHSFADYCFEHNIPIIYPFNMEWGAVVIVSDNNSPINIAKKTKTGNYNDDIRAYIGRYVSFWNHQTPANLLLNYNPVFSNTLMLQMCLNVIALIATGKFVKLFPDMYYCLCNPGKSI